jgi:hypothetical protein
LSILTKKIAAFCGNDWYKKGENFVSKVDYLELVRDIYVVKILWGSV